MFLQVYLNVTSGQGIQNIIDDLITVLKRLMTSFMKINEKINRFKVIRLYLTLSFLVRRTMVELNLISEIL